MGDGIAVNEAGGVKTAWKLLFFTAVCWPDFPVKNFTILGIRVKNFICSRLRLELWGYGRNHFACSYPIKNRSSYLAA